MKPAAQMAELVDAHGSGPCAARRGGSSPLLGTNSLSTQVHDLTGNTQKARFSGLFCCLDMPLHPKIAKLKHAIFIRR